MSTAFLLGAGLSTCLGQASYFGRLKRLLGGGPPNPLVILLEWNFAVNVATIVRNGAL